MLDGSASLSASLRRPATAPSTSQIRSQATRHREEQASRALRATEISTLHALERRNWRKDEEDARKQCAESVRRDRAEIIVAAAIARRDRLADRHHDPISLQLARMQGFHTLAERQRMRSRLPPRPWAGGSQSARPQSARPRSSPAWAERHDGAGARAVRFDHSIVGQRIGVAA